MRPLLHYLPVLQHQDLVAIADRAQSVRHKYTRAVLFLEDTVDVL